VRRSSSRSTIEIVREAARQMLAVAPQADMPVYIDARLIPPA
jgi:hypothetical protein